MIQIINDFIPYKEGSSIVWNSHGNKKHWTGSAGVYGSDKEMKGEKKEKLYLCKKSWYFQANQFNAQNSVNVLSAWGSQMVQNYFCIPLTHLFKQCDHSLFYYSTTDDKSNFFMRKAWFNFKSLLGGILSLNMGVFVLYKLKTNC